MKTKLAEFVIKHRIFFVSGPILFSLLALVPLRRLRIETNLGEFVPEKHPYILVQKKLEQVFGGLNQVSIVVKVRQADIFTPEVLKKIYDLTEELYFTEGVNISRINGLAARKMRKIQADAGGFRIEQLMPGVPQNPREIAVLKETAKRNPMVYGVFVSRDLSSTLIQADFFSGVSSRKIFEKVRALADKAAGPGVEVYYSGRPILEGWLDLYLSRMGYLFLVSLIVLAILLYFSFHSKRGVILPVVSSLMASAWGLVFLMLLKLQISPSTILVPFLVLALGVSHSVQFVKRYYEEAGFSSDPREVNRKVLAGLFAPAAISLITDGAGFLSLCFIPLKLIRTMALSAGIGVFSIFLTTVFFVPAFLSYLKLPEAREIQIEEKPNFLDRFLTLVSSWATFRRVRVFLVFFLLGLVGILGLTRIRVGDNQPGSPALYPGSHYNVSERIINREFAGTDPYYILVAGKGIESLVSSQVLKEMESLQDYLMRNVSQAGRAGSLVEYVKGFNMVFNDGNPAFYRIPDLDLTIGEFIFLYSISGFPGDFDPVCSPDFNNANIKIDLKDHRSSTIRQALQATEQWIKDNHRTDKVDFLYPGGIIGTLAALNDVIRRSIPQSLLIVTPIVFLCVAFSLGGFIYGVCLLVPLLFSIVLTFGLMGLLGVGLTIETLPLASLGMGLGVDYGVYILSRMRAEGSREDGLRTSLLTSGKAVFFTAFSVSVGVLAWVFSPVKMEAKLGLSLAGLLFLNMASALILLPALLTTKKVVKWSKSE